MPTLREAHKEMTRKLLLDAGLDLFVSKGYATTTVDDIASAAGTTRVTFYAYFPTKANLMKALITQRLNPTLDRVPSTERGSTEHELVAVIEDGSHERIRAWLASTSQRWDAARPYINAAAQAAAVDPEIRQLLDAWINETIADIKDGLNRADRFPADTRHIRSALAIATLDHIMRHWTPPHSGLDHDQILDILAESWAGTIGRH